MSILFVLLTFLLILTYSYFRRNETPAMGVQPAPFQKVTAPKMVKAAGIEVPADYGFHLGHTWVRDEGQQNARVGIDGFAGNLFGQVDSVLVSVNHEVLKNPSLISDDPYKNGWLGVVKAPELSTNAKNLLRGPIVPAWLQESYGRLNAMLQPTNPGLAQDGGLPVKGAYFQVDSAAQRKLAKEFFLT
jgi:glycine cleavage system H lipoate-binding protein